MKNKTILITGCSSGIGLCLATALKKQDWQVFATVRNEKDGEPLQKIGVFCVQMDLRDNQSIQTALKTVLAQTQGQLYALCNNAAFGQPGAVEDITRDVLKAQFETNVFGLQALTNYCIPLMRKQGYGRIIQISSVLGFVTMAYRGAYCASKYALEALSDALRLELTGSGVFVSLIEPGPIESAFRKNAQVAFDKHIASQGNSAHKKAYDTLIQNQETLKSKSVFTRAPDALLPAFMHALSHKKPKARYRITVPTHLFAILKRVLPDVCLDGIFRRIMLSEIKANTKKKP